MPSSAESSFTRLTTGRNGWILAGLAVLGQLIVLYTPGKPDGGLELPWLPGADKLIHALIFAVPVFLIGRLVKRAWLVGLIFALHAVLSEIIQGTLIPYRDPDAWDALADLVGVGVALLVLYRTPRPELSRAPATPKPSQNGSPGT